MRRFESTVATVKKRPKTINWRIFFYLKAAYFAYVVSMLLVGEKFIILLHAMWCDAALHSWCSVLTNVLILLLVACKQK